jgi:hypothetical protein
LNNNNRNNRRRGRGNRNQGGGGAQLNRIDSRARGNAPQMLDKYKKLAQDAQHNGDRVQMEYYLQFADHYFRVIADNKARQDEQRGGNGGNGRRNDERDAGDDFEDDFDFGRRNDMPTRSPYEQPQTGGNADVSEGEPGQEGESFLSDDRQDNDRQNDRADDRGGDRGGDRPRGQRRQQQQRKPRDGERDGNRAERSEKRAERPDRSERPAADRTDKPARARKPRKPADGGEQLGIDSAILPPSIRGDDAGPNTNNGDSGTLETVE